MEYLKNNISIEKYIFQLFIILNIINKILNYEEYKII